MSVEIAGIGTAVPEHQIEQDDAAEQASQICCQTQVQQRLVKTLYRRAGVRTRHSVVLNSDTNGRPAEQSFYTQTESGPTTGQRMVAYEASAAPLALAAAREALEKADVAPAEITHLVTVSCSGFASPGFDLALISRLGLTSETSRTHVGFMGCHGALNGMRVANSFVQHDRAACALLCAVELCSLHHQYRWDPEQIVANALFADGAGALVLRGQEMNSANWHVVAQRSAVIPDTEEMMSWRIGDHGFQMTLSAQVPQLLDEQLRPWLAGWLNEYGLAIKDIGSWAVHPGGPRILDACASAIGLSEESLADSREVLAEFGNMSSPTILFILDRMQRRDAPRPCVVLAFGPGLTIEAALLR
ncbi:MAG TPA: type III polyketide synthase [Pirellulales bacterium]|jgi:predicted naringenin-chalcone synthase